MVLFQGDLVELHDHGGGSTGPAAGNCRCPGKARAGGGEEHPHHPVRREQEVGYQSLQVKGQSFLNEPSLDVFFRILSSRLAFYWSIF